MKQNLTKFHWKYYELLFLEILLNEYHLQQFYIDSGTQVWKQDLFCCPDLYIKLVGIVPVLCMQMCNFCLEMCKKYFDC